MTVKHKKQLPFFQKTVSDFSGGEGIEYPKCANCGLSFLPKLARFTRIGERVCPTCFLKIGLKNKARGKREDLPKISEEIKTRSLNFPNPLSSNSLKTHLNIKISEGTA
jgi:hypothetical protein